LRFTANAAAAARISLDLYPPAAAADVKKIYIFLYIYTSPLYYTIFGGSCPELFTLILSAKVVDIIKNM